MYMLKCNADELLGSSLHTLSTHLLFEFLKSSKPKKAFFFQSESFVHVFVISITFVVLKPKCKAAIWKTEIAFNPPQTCSCLFYFSLPNTMKMKKNKSSDAQKGTQPRHQK